MKNIRVVRYAGIYFYFQPGIWNRFDDILVYMSDITFYVHDVQPCMNDMTFYVYDIQVYRRNMYAIF